jgi:putative transposase
MHDRLYCGRPFKVMNIIDDFHREALAMEIDTGIGSLRLVRVLESLRGDGLLPREIRVDNGPEFLSLNFTTWCGAHGIAIKYTQPGKPVQNALIERFNGSYRREVLDRYAFQTLEQARDKTHEWMMHYNYERPHDALQDLSPNEFVLKYGKLGNGEQGAKGTGEFPTFQHDNSNNDNDSLNQKPSKMPTFGLY